MATQAESQDWETLLQRSLTRKRAEIDSLLEDVKFAVQQLQQVQSELKKSEERSANFQQADHAGSTTDLRQREQQARENLTNRLLRASAEIHATSDDPPQKTNSGIDDFFQRYIPRPSAPATPEQRNRTNRSEARPSAQYSLHAAPKDAADVEELKHKFLKEIETRDEHLQKLQAALDSLPDTDALNQEKRKSEQLLNEKDQQLQSLAKQLQEKEQHLTHLRREFAQLREQVRSTAELNEAQQRLASEQQRITTDQQRLQSERRHVEVERAAAAEESRRLAEIAASVGRERERVQSLQQEHAAEQAAARQAMARAEAIASAAREDTNAVASKQQQLNEEWQRLREAEDAFNAKRSKLEQAETHIRARAMALIKEQAEAKARDAHLRERIRNAEEKERSAEEKLGALRTKADCFTHEVAERQREFTALHERLRLQKEELIRERARMQLAVQSSAPASHQALLDGFLKRREEDSNAEVRRLLEENQRVTRQLQDAEARAQLAQAASAQQREQLAHAEATVKRQHEQLAVQEADLRRQQLQLQARAAEQQRDDDVRQQQSTELRRRSDELDEKTRQAQAALKELATRHEQIEARSQMLAHKEQQLEQVNSHQQNLGRTLSHQQQQLEKELKSLEEQKRELKDREDAVARAAELLQRREAQLRERERVLAERSSSLQSESQQTQKQINSLEAAVQQQQQELRSRLQSLDANKTTTGTGASSAAADLSSSPASKHFNSATIRATLATTPSQWTSSAAAPAVTPAPVTATSTTHENRSNLGLHFGSLKLWRQAGERRLELLLSTCETLRKRLSGAALQQLDNLVAQLRALRDEYNHQMQMCSMLEASFARMPEVEVLKLLRTQQTLHNGWEEKLAALQHSVKQLSDGGPPPTTTSHPNHSTTASFATSTASTPQANGLHSQLASSRPAYKSSAASSVHVTASPANAAATAASTSSANNSALDDLLNNSGVFDSIVEAGRMSEPSRFPERIVPPLTPGDLEMKRGELLRKIAMLQLQMKKGANNPQVQRDLDQATADLEALVEKLASSPIS